MNNSAIIFLGPTLSLREASALCSADYRGPAAMGDLTRAVNEAPRAIVLIDGSFESGPSVWHKEILWALSKGIAVIGAASMGALRAAELEDYGMTGFGRVFEMFRSGVLIEDDEVAVLHAPRELNYMPVSDAMVDIRASLELAVANQVLTAQDADRVLKVAKACHFKQRNLAAAVHDGLRSVRSAREILEVGRWISVHACSVKADDTRNLLGKLDDLVELSVRQADRVPPFIETIYLRRLQRYGFPAT